MRMPFFNFIYDEPFHHAESFPHDAPSLHELSTRHDEPIHHVDCNLLVVGDDNYPPVRRVSLDLLGSQTNLEMQIVDAASLREFHGVVLHDGILAEVEARTWQ